MKVHASVRALYEAQLPVAEALQKHVHNALLSDKPPRWHYESRIKQMQSFAVKVESGRVKDPRALEDFLACTIVVPNSGILSDAISWISSKFTIAYQRPKDPAATHKNADAFPFDDIRLYCKRGNDGSRPEEPIDDVVFEIQVKTFLQHAWGIATHDLSYKTDDVRWGKDRIVAHLKAAIEFAEISIQQAEALSHGKALQLVHTPTTMTAEILSVCRKYWNVFDLPENQRGMAETIRTILQDCRLSASDLDKVLSDEKGRTGSLPTNLSPYGTIIQLLLSSHQVTIERMLGDKRAKARLLITPEMNLPSTFNPSKFNERVIQVS